MNQPHRAAPEMPYFISVKKAASIIQMNPAYLRRVIREGGGPPIRRFGRAIRLPFQQFLAWAERPTKGK